MALRTHLSFANVASATALVVALTGGGIAVAAGLAKNSVGSPQVKANSLKSGDIKNDGLKGKDIKESTLTGVASAKAVDTVSTKRATALPGQTKVLASLSTLTVSLVCTDLGGGDIESSVVLTTSADNAMMDANLDGDEESDFDIATGPAEIATEASTAQQDIEDSGFSALTAAGVSWKGYGFAVARPGGSASCLGEMTFFG